jgi:HEPN domain
MGIARFMNSAPGVRIKDSDGQVYNYINFSISRGTSPQNLFFSANIDFLSFISLYHLGIHMGGTYMWLPSHAIEKYLKAFLIIEGSLTVDRVIKYRHNIKKLWKKCIYLYNYSPSDNLSKFMKELSKTSTNIRYGDIDISITAEFVSGLLLLAVHFNYYKDTGNYASTYYGFADHDFSSYNILSGSTKHILKAYLHLFVEHQVSFTSWGTYYKHDFTEVAQYKQDRIEPLCPLCNDPTLNQKLHPTLKNNNIQLLLEEYFKASED